MQDSLAAVAAGVDAKAKLLDDAARFVVQTRRLGRSTQGGRRTTFATGTGSCVSLKGITKDKYARQLDFFGIELAVVMPGNKLVYVRNFSKPKPQTHTGPADQEKRFYLTWRMAISAAPTPSCSNGRASARATGLS